MTLSDFRSTRQANLTLKAPPSIERISPDYPDHPSNVPCPLPRWIETGANVGCFPIPRGLPRYSGGSASTTSLSRPAQALLALRPAGLLNRPRRPLSQGFGVASYPPTPPASFRVNRQLPVWNLPPLTFRAFEAHYQLDCASCRARAEKICWISTQRNHGINLPPISYIDDSKIISGRYQITGILMAECCLVGRNFVAC